MSCSDGSCKLTNKIWGITDGSKLYRLTFSKSLAEHICVLDDSLKIERLEFTLGKPLQPGEKSRSGCYALMSAQSNLALRISLMPEIAELHCDGEYRYLREAFIGR